MRIKRVSLNNRKKAFIIEAGDKVLELPFAVLAVKPSSKNPIHSVCVDEEVGGEGFTYQLRSGKEDTVLLDQVLYINRDPDYVRERLLYELSLEAEKLVNKSKLSKRAVARRLSVSPTQLYRLLDQTFYGKTIDQMIKLLTVLGRDIEISSSRAA